MSLRDVELDIATLLASALSKTLATDVFAGPMPQGAADPAIAVRDQGGPDSEDALSFGVKIFACTAEVLVRGVPHDYGAARALALQAFESCHTPALSGYISVKSQGAGPSYEGVDGSGRHGFTFLVDCRYAV